MTVNQLIKILQRYPKQSTVRIEESWYYWEQVLVVGTKTPPEEIRI